MYTGVGCGLSYAASLTILTQYFHKNYAFANGIAATGSSCGVIILPVAVQALVDHYTWRNALVIMAAIQAHVVVCGALMKTPSRRTVQVHIVEHVHQIGDVVQQFPQENSKNGRLIEIVCTDDDDTETSPDNKEEMKRLPGTTSLRLLDSFEDDDDKRTSSDVEMKKTFDGVSTQRTSQRLLDSFGVSLLWTNRVYLCLLPMFLLNGTAYQTTVIYIKEAALRAGATDFQGAFLISILGISGFFARAGHGMLIDKKIIHVTTMYCFAITLTALAMPFIAVSDNYAVFVVCACCVGFGAGLFISLNFVIIKLIVGVERFPGGAGIAMTLVACSAMSSVALAGMLSLKRMVLPQRRRTKQIQFLNLGNNFEKVPILEEKYM